MSLSNDNGGKNLAVYSLDQSNTTAPSLVTQATTALGASISINPDKTIHYDSSGAGAVQALAAGETATDTFSYWVLTGGSYSKATVSVTVTGTNDAPVVTGPVTGTATEDGAKVSLDALLNASDVDHSTTLLVVNVPATLPAGVSYDATTHLFSLDPSDAAYQSLDTGDETTVSVSFEVSDGTATTNASVSWEIAGQDEPFHVVHDDPNIAVETLVGTDGPDVFAIDFSALNNTVQDYTYLIDFDPSEDLLALVNADPTFKTAKPIFADPGLGDATPDLIRSFDSGTNSGLPNDTVQIVDWNADYALPIASYPDDPYQTFLTTSEWDLLA